MKSLIANETLPIMRLNLRSVMFTKTKSESQILLEREFVHALKSLKGHAVDSEEYVKTLNSVVKIYEMMEEPSSVSKDTLAVVGANLLGIFMIIKHEYVN